MKKHRLKCWPVWFDQTVSDHKPFECREDDRGFDIGHTLWLREWDPLSKVYSGRVAVLLVTGVWHGLPGLSENYCIMSTKLIGVSVEVPGG